MAHLLLAMTEVVKTTGDSLHGATAMPIFSIDNLMNNPGQIKVSKSFKGKISCISF